MRRILLFLCFLLLAPNLPADSVFPYQYQETILENGLKVILIPMKNTGLVSYVTVVRTGSRDEVEPGKSGFAHFFEHMMFRGTPKYSSDLYGTTLAEMGADHNAFTAYDYTAYYLHFPAANLEKIIELESDRFMNTEYTLPAFQTEARAVLGEYNKSVADPFFQLDEKLSDTAFLKSTYKHTIIGFLKDIEDMPNQFDYSLTFFDRFYRPENCALILTGNFEADQAVSWIKKYYSSWKRGTYKAISIEEPEQTEERSVTVSYKGETLPLLALAYKVPAFVADAKDFAALSLFAELAFGETSHLYQELVLKEQKIDLLNTTFLPSRDPFLFTIITRLKKEEDLSSVQATIDAILEKMKTTPVDSKRLTDLKSNRKYSFLMSFDTSKSISGGLYTAGPAYVAMLENVAAVDRLFQTYESITPEDLLMAARKYFHPAKRTRITLTGAK